MALYKGIEFPDDIVPFARHMPALNDHREALASLGATWDTLGLLTHLSRLKADMREVRAGFARLTGDLLVCAASASLAHATAALGRQAQAAVDALVRCLSERAAGAGFLAGDEAVVEACATRAPALLAAMRERLRVHAARYPVYRDIVLLAPDGDVLARLHDGPPGRSQAKLVGRALASPRCIETYGPTDFCGGAAVLSYAARVEHGGRAAGVLALVVDLEGEAARIFEHAAEHDEVLAFADADGRVVVSNDPGRLPAGRRIALVPGSALLRLAGTTCVAQQRAAAPHQGYGNLGWSAIAIAPAEHAFGHDGRGANGSVPAFSGEGVFAPRMRELQSRAREIRRRLDRMVWNGRIHQAAGASASAEAGAFSRALLAEIAAAGRRTGTAFEHASDGLLATVASGLLAEARFLAERAARSLARHLDERAADCRWWARSPALAALEPARARRTFARLHGLYPACAELLLFDGGGRVVAAGRDALLEGSSLSDAWVADCLATDDPTRCATSPFAPNPLYGGATTCIFAAPVLEQGRAIGGVALVLDAAPQLEAMLHAALPDAAGAVAAFCRPDGTSIGRTGDLPVALPAAVLALEPGQSWTGVLSEGGERFIVGATAAGEGPAAIAIVVVPGGTPSSPAADAVPELPSVAGGVEIATFLIGNQLLGVPANAVVECIEITAAVRVWRGGFAQRHAGFIHRNEVALPLVDIAADVNASPDAAHRHAIVLQAGGREFGLLVSELGPVAGMKLSEERAAAGGSGATRLISQLGRAGPVLLPVLSPDAIQGIVGA
jgi:chemotaxis signal transduction protein